MTEEVCISFVGAGPGAADLITLRGLARLESADLVLYAGSLVPESLLEHAPPAAELISSSDKNLAEILALMVTAAERGKKVVRLHSGDPSLYSAVTEQKRALSTAGIASEIIPGVPAFAAAAAEAGIELTQAGGPQSVILTRPGHDGSAISEHESLAELAAHQTALCLHLAGKRLADNLAILIGAYGEDCPAVLAARIGWPDQVLLKMPLGELALSEAAAQVRRAVLLMVTPQPPKDSAASALYSANYRHLDRP